MIDITLPADEVPDDLREYFEMADQPRTSSVLSINTRGWSSGRDDIDHFAVMPEALVERCLLAGSSPRACPVCRAPWRRVVEKVRLLPAAPSGNREVGRWDAQPEGQVGGRTTTHERGWEPTCTCPDNDGSARCVVLDCFAGSGTTLRVATRHGRDALGIELNPQYIELADQRTAGVQMSMESMVL